MAPKKQSKKPQRSGKAINVWLPKNLYGAMNAFRNKQRIPPNITDVVELALQEFLEREGVHVPPDDEDDDA